jgi:hypothetical protein
MKMSEKILLDIIQTLNYRILYLALITILLKNFEITNILAVNNLLIF